MHKHYASKINQKLSLILLSYIVPYIALTVSYSSTMQLARLWRPLCANEVTCLATLGHSAREFR